MDSDSEKKQPTTKELYLAYLRGEVTLDAVEASAVATFSAFAARRATTAKQPE